jgi:hypothetical protein
MTSGHGPLPTDWVLHDDPAGFSLVKPRAWRVQADGAGEISVSEPHGDAVALVRARVLPLQTDLAAWLQQHYAATEHGLYGVRLWRIEAHAPRVVCAAFDYGSRVFQGCARVVAVRDREGAMLFVGAAAREQFGQRWPELARILDSVRQPPAAVSLSGRTARSPAARRLP